ncbi:MAG: zinc ribbon domain-containing protein [Candidatus Methanomethylicaceae archaeon]
MEYKTRKWLGIRVIKVSERGTPKTCHKCGHEGLRVGSIFKCQNCKYTCKEDYNGAINILNRGVGYMPAPWVALAQPIKV